MRFRLRYPTVLILFAGLASNVAVLAQELVISAYQHRAQGEGDPVVVIPDLAATMPAPAFVYVAPVVAQQPLMKPHGLTLVSANEALVTSKQTEDADSGGVIDVLDTVTATRVASFTPPGYEADGLGSLAMDPSRSTLLAFSGRSNSQLFVVPAPFSDTSSGSSVTMPSNGGSGQTHAIAFDQTTGRAFVGHQNGISALDPPYTTIAFTIPLPPSQGGTVAGRAVALTADGNTLASAVLDDKVEILHAPFSAASTPVELTVDDALQLNGLVFTPDNSQLLVVDQSYLQADAIVYAIPAPFNNATLAQPLSTGEVGQGFEDIDISADGQYAALSGGDEIGDPLYILRAPFTTAAVQSTAVQIPALLNLYDDYGGRGTGSARFWSEPAPTPPQLQADFIVSHTAGSSGTSMLAARVRLSRTSAQSVSVDYATYDGSLTAPADYTATTGTLTFAPGQLDAYVMVPVVGNTSPPGNFFNIKYDNPVNASLLNPGIRIECDIFYPAQRMAIVNDPPLPDAHVRSPYSVTFTGAGSSNGYSDWMALTDLPDGLILDADTGVLSGIPTNIGNTVVNIMVVNNEHTQSAIRAYELSTRSDRIFANGFE